MVLGICATWYDTTSPAFADQPLIICTPTQAVHLAAIKGGVDGAACLRLLLDAGAESVSAARENWRPMHFAAARGNEGCVQLLLEAESAETDGNSSVRAATDEGFTPEALAIRHSQHHVAHLFVK